MIFLIRHGETVGNASRTVQLPDSHVFVYREALDEIWLRHHGASESGRASIPRVANGPPTWPPTATGNYDAMGTSSSSFSLAGLARPQSTIL